MAWMIPPPETAIAISAPCIDGCELAMAAPGGGTPDTAPPRNAKPDIAPLPATAPADGSGKLKIGATLRGRYDLRFDDRGSNGADRTSSHLSFDTLALTADYKSDRFFGSAQYRVYGGSFIYGRRAGYDSYPGEVHFLMYAYGGAKLSASDSVTVGVQPVPYDDRWWGSSILNDLAFVYGLEETYNLGLSYRREKPAYRVELGFFPSSGPNGVGISRDSARYSTNIVKGDSYLVDGSRNEERNMVIGNIRYTLADGDALKLHATASGWLSTIHNFDTGQNGHKRMFAGSLTAASGAWHAKALASRQDISPRNPGNNDVISVGGFDASYNIAAKGTYLFGEIGRDFAPDAIPFDVTIFADYGHFLKDATGFRDSERFDLGAVWTQRGSKRIKVYTELLVGRNDPYVGAGQFAYGAAQGGDNRWKTAFLMIFGYSF